VKIFTAHKRLGGAFVHHGVFEAPKATADRDLWKVAANA